MSACGAWRGAAATGGIQNYETIKNTGEMWPASFRAIDFKAKGQWIMSFDYGNGSNFTNKQRQSRNGVHGYGGNSANTTSADSFSAEQRVRLQLDAVASESLSGTVFFEIGEQVWGSNRVGAALGADGPVLG